MKTRIIVCNHKQDICVKEPPYFPIHVGKELHKDVNLDMQADNVGDNISSKNGSYCELTGLYWLWKKLKDEEVVGLCHYRRYFDFHNQCQKLFPHTIFSSSDVSNLDYSIPEKIISKIKNGSIVLAKPRIYEMSLKLDYCYAHISDDFRIMTDVIMNTHEKNIIDAYIKVMNSNKLSHYNMFMMNRQNFEEYCNWLFPILGEIESRTNIDHYNPDQKRIYGYMAERLLNVWVEAKKCDIMYKPVIWFVDAKINTPKSIHYWINCKLFTIANTIINFTKEFRYKPTI